MSDEAARKRSCWRPLALVVTAGLAWSAPLPLAARQYEILRPLPATAVGKLTIAKVEVTLSDEAARAMREHDAKADARRTAAGASRTGDGYDRLPFTQMFPLVMQGVSQRAGVEGARPVRLRVTVIEFATANAGEAMLFGSDDVLSGIVEVDDATDGRGLGLFTVKVVNGHAGWSGMLIRGGGIREKLVHEFALECAHVLSGRKSRKPSSRPVRD